jgi:TRAP-type C4-dicarboxylate transport system permease small subunit
MVCLKLLKQIDQLLGKLCMVVSVFMCIVMIASGSLQIVSRFVFRHSIGWTEELCRYAAIWMVMFMAAQAAREKSHISLDCVSELLGKRGKLVLDKLSSILILIFSGYVAKYGMTYALSTMNTLTPGLFWPYGLVRMAVPIGSMIACFYSLYNLFSIDELLARKAGGVNL